MQDLGFSLVPQVGSGCTCCNAGGWGGGGGEISEGENLRQVSVRHKRGACMPVICFD